MMAAASASSANIAATLQSLNCVKSARELLPPSFSLHSIDLPELDENAEHPRMISVTLRTINNDRLFNNRRYELK